MTTKTKTFDLYKHQFCLSDLPIETVQIMRANAIRTGSQCGGHKKAVRNEELQAFYEEYLAFKGVEVDTSISGQFNGPGSS